MSENAGFCDGVATSAPSGCVSADEAAAAILASMPGATPARLRRLLHRWSPVDALSSLREGAAEVVDVLSGTGRPEDIRRAWRAFTAAASPDHVMAALERAGVSIWWTGSERWETIFRDDPSPPAVLFVRGDPSVLAHPRVAVVGTRTPTSAGLEFASLLGRELAVAGVAVVSGLALGIDGAAHRGALRPLLPRRGDGPGAALATGSPPAGIGRPIGVVGSGLDIVYPRAHGALWEQVGSEGLLMSEAPMGKGPTPISFPERNRIIAQLATVVVVVESHEKGGSLITVDRALERGRRVLAVPGNPLNKAAAGTNALLRGGAAERIAVACHGASDVLALLDLDRACSPSYSDSRPEPSAAGNGLLAVMGWDPWSLGRLVQRCGLPPAAVSHALAVLEEQGWIGRTGGAWHRLAGGDG